MRWRALFGRFGPPPQMHIQEMPTWPLSSLANYPALTKPTNSQICLVYKWDQLDGLPAAAKALCLLPQQCLPRHSSPSATLQCWALIYFNTFQHFFFFLKINEEKRLLAVDFLLLFPVGHLDVHPPYCIKRFYDGKFIHLKKKDKQIEIKCTDVMPNRTFYSSAQISAYSHIAIERGYNLLHWSINSSLGLSCLSL